METFDLAAVPELDIRLFRDLVGGGYIREHRNVIFLGRSGAGKTHMATALGIETCKTEPTLEQHNIFKSLKISPPKRMQDIQMNP